MSENVYNKELFKQAKNEINRTCKRRKLKNDNAGNFNY